MAESNPLTRAQQTCPLCEQRKPTGYTLCQSCDLQTKYGNPLIEAWIGLFEIRLGK